MDFEKFDKFAGDRDASDEDYFAYVGWLSELTANELRQAKGNPEQQKLAVCRYYKRGERANLTRGELIDFLGISAFSILDRAGYTEAEVNALFVISDRLTVTDVLQTTLEDGSQLKLFSE